MPAEHIGGLKSQQQGLLVFKCVGWWLDLFLRVNWSFPFSVKCLYLELGQRTRELPGFPAQLAAAGRGGAVPLLQPGFVWCWSISLAGAHWLRQHQLTAFIALVFGKKLLFNF